MQQVRGVFVDLAFRQTAKIIAEQDKSAAGFCRQAAAWVQDMICNFYAAKWHKIANKSPTTEAREKISIDLESIE